MLRAAAADFYQLRWSKEILDEMERNLVSTMTMSADKAARLRAQMEKYFPEAMFGNWLVSADRAASTTRCVTS